MLDRQFRLWIFESRGWIVNRIAQDSQAPRQATLPHRQSKILSTVLVFVQQLAETRVVAHRVEVAVLAHVAEVAIAQLDRVAQRLEALVGPLQAGIRSEEQTSELQSLRHLVCRLLLDK